MAAEMKAAEEAPKTMKATEAEVEQEVTKQEHEHLAHRTAEEVARDVCRGSLSLLRMSAQRKDCQAYYLPGVQLLHDLTGKMPDTKLARRCGDECRDSLK